MPTYEYECEACGHRLEEFQSMTAKPLTTCPACRKRKLKRLIGTGAGLIFRGSGFYITDYRSGDYKKQASAEKSSASSSSSSGDGAAKSESASKSDGAKATKPAKAAKSD